VSKQSTLVATQVSPIGFPPAAATWALGWVIGMGLLGSLVVAASGTEAGDDISIATLALVSMVGWATFLVALTVTSRRHGSGDVVRDYAVRFEPADLIGVVLGAATQLVLVPVLYWPLRQIWPDTFAPERLEERAQDLADRAGGVSTVLLVLVVVVGAPIVEELVYRGLLQRSLSNLITPWPALGFTALWFAFIHLSWIEIPGLFLAGLVFGACVVVTRRIGTAIVTHAAFNAVGIWVVLSNR
jgi:membrane protease YdiL (CAAX protease family)